MEWGGFAMLVCRRAGRRRAVTWVGLALVLAGLTAAVGQARAGDEDLFRVLDVKVDETDQTAAAARVKALAVGERRAWDILVQRFVDPQQKRPLPDFSQQEVGDAVKDFWVSDEKTSAVRYIATLNYNFRPDAVRRLLGSRGLRYTTTAAKLAVVVPVYVAGNETRLWGQGNPWHEVWSGMHGRPLVPLRIPAGDAGDQAALTPDQAVAGDRAKLTELAQRAGAEDTLVTVATVAVTPDGTRQLKVASVRQTAGGPLPLGERVFPIEGADGETDALRQAAAAVLGDLDAAWRRGAAATGKPSTRTTVVVPTGSLEQWVSMRRRLIALPQAQQVNVASVSRDEAHIVFVFPGTTDQLTAALAGAGITLRNEDGKWTVSEGVQAPTGGSAPR